jgi:putative membrane protein
MNAYLLFKSLHLLAVISWMAGLLYLPRIFVYHSENINREEICTVFKIMERKLYNYIMMPAMILTWIFGLILISQLGFEALSAMWLQIKLILVTLLSVYHFYLGSLLISFNNNNNTKSPKFFRWLNEFPTLLLIIIVFVVIFKPM